MATELRLRGGTTAQHASFTGATKEITVDTTKNTVVVHDGSTAGGYPLLNQTDLNNTLTSTSTAQALTAAQGKVLQDTTVKLTGNQTINDIKTFNSKIVTNSLGATSNQNTISVTGSLDINALDGVYIAPGTNFSSIFIDRESIVSNTQFGGTTSNISGAAGGGSGLSLGKNRISLQTYAPVTNVGDPISIQERMVIDGANQRVGIGVSTPTFPLDVNGDINATGSEASLRIGGQIAARRTNATGEIRIGSGTDTDFLAFYSGARLRAKINTNGQQESVIANGTTLYPEFKVRAWVRFNGNLASPITPANSGNISSVVRVSNGYYSINFATAMPSNDYAIGLGGSRTNSSSSAGANIGSQRAILRGTTSFAIITTDSGVNNLNWEAVEAQIVI